MNLYCLLVPTTRNKPLGKNPYYTTRYHRVWDSKVRKITGGLTILVPSRGQWISPNGDLYEEKMIPVQLMCTKEQIEEIADMTAKYYQQLAIFYYKVSDEVVIKHYDH